jgi:deazaflavin-dependent oxidoreductase (nitroreductase family)
MNMPLDGEYEPSPWEPIAEQVEQYERTNGVEGGEFMGGPCIILTTKGARSGKLRKTPLIQVTDGTSYVVIGSMGGAPDHPQWVHNLRANPLVELQDGADRRDYTAREVSDDEKATWWSLATGVWPDYDTYQSSTDRVIPLFVLDPVV